LSFSLLYLCYPWPSVIVLWLVWQAVSVFPVHSIKNSQDSNPSPYNISNTLSPWHFHILTS
jgi:hypothetical protein